MLNFLVCLVLINFFPMFEYRKYDFLMNFDVQIHHIVNYRFVQNLQSRAIASLVNKWLYGFCRIVSNHKIVFAYLNYKSFIFTPTQLVRVIHIHRLVCSFRRFQTPQSTVLARAFLFVHKSQNIYSIW